MKWIKVEPDWEDMALYAGSNVTSIALANFDVPKCDAMFFAPAYFENEGVEMAYGACVIYFGGPWEILQTPYSSLGFTVYSVEHSENDGIYHIKAEVGKATEMNDFFYVLPIIFSTPG